MPDREFPGKSPNLFEAGLHHLIPGGRHEPVDGRTVRGHRVLWDAAELEDHGIQVATADDLLLDRDLDPFGRKRSIANQKRSECRHSLRPWWLRVYRGVNAVVCKMPSDR